MLPVHTFSELNAGLCRLTLQAGEQLNRLGAGFRAQIRRVSNNHNMREPSSITQIPIVTIFGSNEEQKDIGIEPSREYQQRRIKAKKVILDAFRKHKNRLKNTPVNEVGVKILTAQNTDKYYFYNNVFIGHLPQKNILTLDSSNIRTGGNKKLISYNNRYLKFEINDHKNKTAFQNETLNNQHVNLNNTNIEISKIAPHFVPTFYINNSEMIIKYSGDDLQKLIENNCQIPPECFINMFEGVQKMSELEFFSLDLKLGNLTLQNNIVKRIDTNCIYPLLPFHYSRNTHYSTESFLDKAFNTTKKKRDIILHNDMMRTLIIIMAEADLSCTSDTGYYSSEHLTSIKSWVTNGPLKHLKHKIFPLLENPELLKHKFKLNLALELKSRR